MSEVRTWVLLAGGPLHTKAPRWAVQDPLPAEPVRGPNLSLLRAVETASLKVGDAVRFTLAEAAERCDGSDFLMVPLSVALAWDRAVEREHDALIEVGQLSSLIETAALSCDHDDTQAKLTLAMTAAPCDSVGGSACFALDTNYVVVPRRVWEEKAYVYSE